MNNAFGIHVKFLAVARKVFPATACACLLSLLTACGSTPRSSNPTGGALSGNWQLSLFQEEPRPTQTLAVSGFVRESSNSLSGSFAFPQSTVNGNCAGVATVTGTVNGQSIQLSANQGGTVLSFTGTISSDGQSMSGNYQGLGGGCFTRPTTGTWSGILIPPLNGNFTGTLSNSTYMPLVNGVVPPAPIAVTGTLTQSPNNGASNATLQGTITAVGYPCFSTASLTGTISGANVILALFGYNGEQIGSIGSPNTPGVAAAGSAGPTLTGTGGTSGLTLGGSTPTGVFGPCPPLLNNGALQPDDTANVAFSFQ